MLSASNCGLIHKPSCFYALKAAPESMQLVPHECLLRWIGWPSLAGLQKVHVLGPWRGL